MSASLVKSNKYLWHWLLFQDLRHSPAQGRVNLCWQYVRTNIPFRKSQRRWQLSEELDNSQDRNSAPPNATDIPAGVWKTLVCLFSLYINEHHHLCNALEACFDDDHNILQGIAHHKFISVFFHLLQSTVEMLQPTRMMIFRFLWQCRTNNSLNKKVTDICFFSFFPTAAKGISSSFLWHKLLNCIIVDGCGD